MGRWLTPDAGGLTIVDPFNPQSWNRCVREQQSTERRRSVGGWTALAMNREIARVPDGLLCPLVRLSIDPAETGVSVGFCIFKIESSCRSPPYDYRKLPKQHMVLFRAFFFRPFGAYDRPELKAPRQAQ
jgi:hypothetical protein